MMDAKQFAEVIREARKCLANQKGLLKRLGLDPKTFGRIAQETPRGKGEEAGARLKEEIKAKRTRVNTNKRDKFMV